MTEKKTNEKRRYIYLGTEEARGGDLVVVLRPLPEFYKVADVSATLLDLADPANALYSLDVLKKSALRWSTPGAVVEIEMADSGSIYPTTATNVERWPDADVCAQLIAAERAREAVRAAERTNKKIGATDELLEALAPIRAAYRGSVGRNRVHLLARIVAYITS
jgi:hypothetical protein